MRTPYLFVLLLGCSADTRPELDATSPTDGAVPDAICVIATPSREPCPQATVALDVRGESPLGPIHVTQARLAFWSGFDSGVWIYMQASAGGHQLELSAQLYAPIGLGLSKGDTIPPGRYQNTPAEGGTKLLFASLQDCDTGHQLENAELRVDVANRPVQSHEQGDPYEFRGEFTVSDPGWSLRVPLALNRICDSWNSL